MDVLLSIVTFFLAIVVLALVVAQYLLRTRLAEQETRLAALTQRIYNLEHPPPARFKPAPLQPTPLEPIELEPIEPTPEPPPLPLEETAVPPPATQDWEAVVGGNWLNRVGALVLVIGIALFLGYSLTHLGPAGKVGIGFIVGASMLAGGMALRTSEPYGSFALSLVGGGWAAIYFTAYAAHALEPARVITSPITAAALLAAVSLAMIGHALWYRSETGTALAFVFSFITLNVTPLETFSVYASVLLAISLLVVAHLRSWFRLAVTGVVLAYATFFLRGETAAPLSRFALWAQWAAFEGFDFLDLRRRGFQRGIEHSVFLLNACGFLGVALLYQTKPYGSNDLAWFLGVSGAAYLVSTVLRARLSTDAVDPATRVLGGGYEGALVASTILLAGAIIQRFSGTTMTLALLAHGEMIVLAGLSLKNAFVRALGGAVLFVVFFRVVCVDAQIGTTARAWTPTAFLVAWLFIANRIRGGWGYSAGAAILLGMVAEAEVARDWFPFALALMGLAALLFALSRNLYDVRLQHLLWAPAIWIAAAVALDRGTSANLPVALTVACFYASEFLVRGRPSRYALERYAGAFYSLLGTGLLTLLLFSEVQGRLLTVALGLEGAALLVAGLFASERILRISGLALFLLCIGKAFLYDLRQLDTLSRILSFIVLGLLLLGASWVYTRFRERIKRLL